MTQHVAVRCVVHPSLNTSLNPTTTLFIPNVPLNTTLHDVAVRCLAPTPLTAIVLFSRHEICFASKELHRTTIGELLELLVATQEDAGEEKNGASAADVVSGQTTSSTNFTPVSHFEKKSLTEEVRTIVLMFMSWTALLRAVLVENNVSSTTSALAVELMNQGGVSVQSKSTANMSSTTPRPSSNANLLQPQSPPSRLFLSGSSSSAVRGHIVVVSDKDDGGRRGSPSNSKKRDRGDGLETPASECKSPLGAIKHLRMEDDPSPIHSRGWLKELHTPPRVRETSSEKGCLVTPLVSTSVFSFIDDIKFANQLLQAPIASNVASLESPTSAVLLCPPLLSRAVSPRVDGTIVVPNPSGILPLSPLLSLGGRLPTTAYLQRPLYPPPSFSASSSSAPVLRPTPNSNAATSAVQLLKTLKLATMHLLCHQCRLLPVSLPIVMLCCGARMCEACYEANLSNTSACPICELNLEEPKYRRCGPNYEEQLVVALRAVQKQVGTPTSPGSVPIPK